MERPERPTRHRSHPVGKPKLPIRPSFSSDSEDSEHSEGAPVQINFYQPHQMQPMSDSGVDGPSTSTSVPQTNSTSSELPANLSKITVAASTGFGIKTFPAQRPLNVNMSPMPLSSVEEEETRPEPQSQDATVRNRKRSAASSAAAIFDGVDTLIGSNGSNERMMDSPEQQEFQHSDFVIRPRSFCNIDYCSNGSASSGSGGSGSGSGSGRLYKHKRLTAPIDLTSSLPSSSSASRSGVGPMCSNSSRSDMGDSIYMNRANGAPPYVPTQRREPSTCSTSSSILRQFDEMCSSNLMTRRRSRFGFNVRFCDNSDILNRYSQEMTNSNDTANSMAAPFISGESPRPSRVSNNVDDYCDLVGNFLFSYPSMHNDSSRTSADSLLPMPSRSPPLLPERGSVPESQSAGSVNLVTRPISSIPATSRINILNHVAAPSQLVPNVEEIVIESNDDVIVVGTPDRLSQPGSPDVVPSSRSPTPPSTGSSATTNKNKPNSSGVEVPMTLQDLNQTLVSLLECPVCLDHATPPIYQCSKGHILCQSCHPRLSTCPICRSRLPGDRNSSMEKVAEKLMYPCKNTVTGCTMMLKLDDKSEHEEGCGFRHYACIIPSCHWKGYKPELVVHLQSNHPDKLIIGDQQEIHIPLSVPMGNSMFITHHWIQSAHNEVFNVIFFIDLYKRIIKGCVTYVGAPEKAGKFTYTFELKQRTLPFRKLTFSRTTHVDTHKPGHPLSLSNDFSINIDMARLYRPEDCTVRGIPVNISIQPVAVD